MAWPRTQNLEPRSDNRSCSDLLISFQDRRDATASRLGWSSVRYEHQCHVRRAAPPSHCWWPQDQDRDQDQPLSSFERSGVRIFMIPGFWYSRLNVGSLVPFVVLLEQLLSCSSANNAR